MKKSNFKRNTYWVTIAEKNVIATLGTLRTGTHMWANSMWISNSARGRITSKNHQWHEIDWRKAEAKVRDYQEKIVVATLKKDIKQVYKLQWSLIKCFEAQALAVKKIITNKGVLRKNSWSR